MAKSVRFDPKEGFSPYLDREPTEADIKWLTGLIRETWSANAEWRRQVERCESATVQMMTTSDGVVYHPVVPDGEIRSE